MSQRLEVSYTWRQRWKSNSVESKGDKKKLIGTTISWNHHNYFLDINSFCRTVSVIQREDCIKRFIKK